VRAGLDVGVDLEHKGCGVHEDALESVADVVRENRREPKGKAGIMRERSQAQHRAVQRQSCPCEQ
jgi:hypothetical protein